MSITPHALEQDPRRSHPNVLLVFPKFNSNSFWSLKDACDLWGAQWPAPPLGLITLAAMLPAEWNLKLVDCNASPLAEADIAWADLVMTGGMLPQQPNTLAVMATCQKKGKPVCIGGPDPTSTPEIYAEADFLVLGEAEGIIEQFIQAWRDGARTGRFEAVKFQADVTKSPIPRFDLLDRSNYLFVGVQFSRGCPFTCEFCDIIELYGRAPRTKTNAQMLAELDALLALGHRGHVDFVDDNLIGNKKAIKLFLPHLIAWQERNGYPFEFSTEASLNLADDAELLGMMRKANFFVVFVGIESSDEATLVATQKKQNTRRDIAASVHRIYAAGMFVIAGFIVGFDTEGDSVADGLVNCIETTGIPTAMVGLLYALPNTQLLRRLHREGRLINDGRPTALDAGDQCTAGLNFRTLRPRRQILEDYRRVLLRVYEPAAFFGRVRRLGRLLDRPSFGTGSSVVSWLELKLLGRLAFRMTVRPAFARHFWATLIDCARHNPGALKFVVMNMVFFLHLHRFSRFVIQQLEARIEAREEEAWPPFVPADATAAGMPLIAVADSASRAPALTGA